jgi:hypothetical protein
MACKGFLRDDLLLLLVCNAQDAVHRLRIDVHYRSVEVRRKAAQAELPMFERQCN